MRARLPLAFWKVPPWPGANPSPRPVILLYHAVIKAPTDPWGLRVSPRNFAEHMAILSAHANPMRLDQLGDALDRDSVPDRCVVVTFDDGYADNLIHAKPAMERHGVPGTVFVASGYVGSSHEYWWDALDRIFLQSGRLPPTLNLTIGEKAHQWELGTAANYGPIEAWKHRRWRAWQEPFPTQRQFLFHAIWHLLRVSTTQARQQALESLHRWAGVGEQGRASHLCCTTEQLGRLAAGELVEIGAHTVTHPSLGSIPPDHQEREIRDSKAALEKLVGRPVTSFSYPFGSRTDYSPGTIRLLKQAGFQRTCSNFGAVITPDADRFQYPRRVVLDWTGQEFTRWLAKWFDERA